MLNKRQLSLCFLCGLAIEMILVGWSIRTYYDNKQYIELAITLAIIAVMFIIIRKCLNIMLSVRKNTDITLLKEDNIDKI